MIDFSGLPTTPKTYAGACGKKVSVIYDGDVYMLKFPSRATKNPNLHYSNSVLSEHIGCKVYQELGIDAQDTILGTYETRGRTLPVVACKDFTSNGYVLQDFASIIKTL